MSYQIKIVIEYFVDLLNVYEVYSGVNHKEPNKKKKRTKRIRIP